MREGGGRWSAGGRFPPPCRTCVFFRGGGGKRKTVHRWIDTISQGVLLRSTAASVDSSQALCVDPGSRLCSELSWMYCAAPLVVEYLMRFWVLDFRVFFVVIIVVEVECFCVVARP